MAYSNYQQPILPVIVIGIVVILLGMGAYGLFFQLTEEYHNVSRPEIDYCGDSHRLLGPSGTESTDQYVLRRKKYMSDGTESWINDQYFRTYEAAQKTCDRIAGR